MALGFFEPANKKKPGYVDTASNISTGCFYPFFFIEFCQFYFIFSSLLHIDDVPFSLYETVFCVVFCVSHKYPPTILTSSQSFPRCNGGTVEIGSWPH